MFRRHRSLLVEPRLEWARIASEDTPLPALFLTWLLPLALVSALGPLLRFVLWTAWMGTQAGTSIAPYALGGALVEIVGGLVSVVLTGAVAGYLAPYFQGTRGWALGIRLVAYAALPGFLGSALTFLPFGYVASFAGGLWSIYLLSEGVTPVMKSAPEKRYPYTAAIVLTVVVVMFLLSLLSRCSVGHLAMSAPTETTGSASSGNVASADAKGSASSKREKAKREREQGGGTFQMDEEALQKAKAAMEELKHSKELKEFERAGKQAAEEAGKMPKGSAKPSSLARFLPDKVHGFARSQMESHLVPPMSDKAGGFAEAKATYGGKAGQPTIRVEIGDNTPLTLAMVNMRKIFTETEKETARVRDRWSTEGAYYWNSRDEKTLKETSFSVLIAERFVVKVIVKSLPDEPDAAEKIARSLPWKDIEALKDEVTQ